MFVAVKKCLYLKMYNGYLEYIVYMRIKTARFITQLFTDFLGFTCDEKKYKTENPLSSDAQNVFST